MDFVENANAIVALISAVVGLLSAAIPLGVVIYNLFKGKKSKEIFADLKDMAMAAIVEAEKTGKTGAEKKEIAIAAVKAAAAAKNIDIEPFMNQLLAVIDQIVATNNAFIEAKKN